MLHARVACRHLTGSAVNSAEVSKFAALGRRWWQLAADTAPLHAMQPARLSFIRREVEAHFGMAAAAGSKPLAGLRVLDVGCGGGLLAESLARLGADEVVAIDPAEENVGIARWHAQGSPATSAIRYQATTAAELVASGDTFDLVCSLEVMEHVPQPAEFAAELCSLARPGGMVVTSTLNRTGKAYAIGIMLAEHVLRAVTPGTHDWDAFITPEEMVAFMAAGGADEVARSGIVIDLQPLPAFKLDDHDLDVNYIMAFTRNADPHSDAVEEAAEAASSAPPLPSS